MIPKIDRIFATHTIPRVGKSNNDPPFASDKIKVHMEEKEIEHSQITRAAGEFRSRELHEIEIGERISINFC